MFKPSETSGYELSNNFKFKKKRYGLTKEIIIYVKDKRLIWMPWQFFRNNCETLGVIETFQSTCFEHAFFKACQHAIENE